MNLSAKHYIQMNITPNCHLQIKGVLTAEVDRKPKNVT